MTVDIVIRSYWRDLPWLEYALASIRRYCVDFRETILVMPEKSVPWMTRSRVKLAQERLVTCPDFAVDYLGQQVTKLYADELSDADYICHVDSDCVFRRPISPHSLIASGKPRIVWRSHESLPVHWPWKEPTSEFLGELPARDFMQRPPFVFPSWLYEDLRRWCADSKGVELADWVLSRSDRGFSEFNVLAGFAWLFHRDAFLWVSADSCDHEERACDWHWSWGGIEVARADMESALRWPS